MASIENFFSYFKIGNAGFLLYSGGYTYQDTKKYFQEGCEYFKQSKPAVAFIVGVSIAFPYICIHTHKM